MTLKFLDDVSLQDISGGVGQSIMIYNPEDGSFNQRLDLVAQGEPAAKSFKITRGPAADTVNLNGGDALSKI